MPNITTTTHDVYIDEAWAAEINRAVEFELLIFKTFDDKSAEAPHGDTYHLPARHHLSTSAKAASTDLTPQASTETQQNYTINTHRGIAIEVEDIAEIQSKYDVRKGHTEDLSYSLARDMETDATGLFDDNTTQTVGVIQQELTDANLIRAWQYLEDAGCPRTGRLVVMSPATQGGLMKLDVFRSHLYVADADVTRKAELSTLYKAELIVSNLTVGTAPSSSGHMYHKSHFFKIVRRQIETHTWYSPLALAWIVSADTIYGVFERQEADEAGGVTTTARLWGVRLQTLK